MQKRMGHVGRILGASLAMGMGALVMGSAYVTLYEHFTGKTFDAYN